MNPPNRMLKNKNMAAYSCSFASEAKVYIDASDYVILEYRIDGGSWTDLLAFENDGRGISDLSLFQCDSC